MSSTEGRKPLRQDNPYEKGYLSKAPKRTGIIACNLDDLFILIESTSSERERVLLQFVSTSLSKSIFSISGTISFIFTVLEL
jgi:integrase/recombinase XerC